jgi:hypothetical protein
MMHGVLRTGSGLMTLLLYIRNVHMQLYMWLVRLITCLVGDGQLAGSSHCFGY